ncbi:hypothetical protein [Endozoicomonas acroporae]|uniref:hypothetical protein n=1 Tax=Endozoicomonas acroporae TaxID=1701104 RepID=UPI003D7BBDFF
MSLLTPVVLTTREMHDIRFGEPTDLAHGQVFQLIDYQGNLKAFYVLVHHEGRIFNWAICDDIEDVNERSVELAIRSAIEQYNFSKESGSQSFEQLYPLNPSAQKSSDKEPEVQKEHQEQRESNHVFVIRNNRSGRFLKRDSFAFVRQLHQGRFARRPAVARHQVVNHGKQRPSSLLNLNSQARNEHQGTHRQGVKVSRSIRRSNARMYSLV